MKRPQKMLVAIVVLATVLAWGVRAAVGFAADDADRDALQGIWAAVSSEDDGKKTAAEELKYSVLVIRGDKFTHTNGSNTITGTFKLIDISGNPKSLDSLPNGGPFAGKTIPGIYEVKDGTLRLCLGLPGKKRPAQFTAAAGTGNELSVFQKVQGRPSGR